ncbi:MAG: DNA polymerase III subunit, partial [Candidatus Velamenicoccus archaeovorus]
MGEAGPVPVLERVPGQDQAMAFLRQAVARPHHAYLFGGPEGGGKSLAARAFAAALLCKQGGCGTCRDCRLALEDRHPNLFPVEPEGRDIHVDTIRAEVWHPAFRTAPEPGRKVFVIREADRLNPAAADTLLKVLEEPPADAVLLLLSARPQELPETILSRCHVVTFQPLAEDFVVDTLVAEGVAGERARLAARLAGGNLGRARRLATAEDGLAFRDVAIEALERALRGPAGALDAAELVLAAAERYRKGLKDQLEEEVAPFLDERGRPEEAYRGAIRRLEERHKRRVRRAERDFVDWVLLAVSSVLRDRIVGAVGGGPDVLVNLDLPPA